MNEFMMFLKTDWNGLWAGAVLISGSLWLFSMMPTAHRRKTLTAAKAVQMMNNESAVMVDVRDKNDYVQGHIPGSRNAPVANIAESINKLGVKKGVPIILSCETGIRAKQAFKTLTSLGFDKTYVLESGISGWKDAGMPVIK